MVDLWSFSRVVRSVAFSFELAIVRFEIVSELAVFAASSFSYFLREKEGCECDYRLLVQVTDNDSANIAKQ